MRAVAHAVLFRIRLVACIRSHSGVSSRYPSIQLYISGHQPPYDRRRRGRRRHVRSLRYHVATTGRW